MLTTEHILTITRCFAWPLFLLFIMFMLNREKNEVKRAKTKREVEDKLPKL